jgi:hypothetical protein
LERLSFSLMGLTADHLRRLCDGPAIRHLRELDLWHNRVTDDAVWHSMGELRPTLRVLGLAGIKTLGRGFEAFTQYDATGPLRQLDLSRNVFSPRTARALSRSRWVAGVRSLNLGQCQIGERELHHLTRAKFWEHLVELDLRDNPIPAKGVRRLLDAPVPPDLTALVLTGERIGSDSRDELRKRYGERVVFAPSGV